MKNKNNTGQINLMEPIFVDGFAGGGGWSVGFELATGRPIDIAINHDPDAVLMHETNHPYTKHYCEDIFSVSPREAVGCRKVAWAHFSPDCKHFSRAKGGKPADKKIRGLAWVVLRWAAEVRPDIISLENVGEFKTWGPVRKGKPVKSKVGQTFQCWRQQLENLGYAVESRELIASHYGAPTSRKRLFIIARCDGKPIVWPEATHGDPASPEVTDGKRKPWKTAVDVIDWTLQAPSIFADKSEIFNKYGIKAVRPLAGNTLRRIIRGIDRFVLQNPSPYVVQRNMGDEKETLQMTVINHSGNFRGQKMAEPLQTITSKHGYGMSSAKLTPVMVTNNENVAGSSPDSPINTVTTGGHHMLLAPSLIQYHSEQTEKVRGQQVSEPIFTIDAANRHALTVPTLTKYYGSDSHGQAVDQPLHTITARDREGVVTATCTPYSPKELPYISKYFSGGYTGAGSSVQEPLPTITAVDHNALVMIDVAKKNQQLRAPEEQETKSKIQVVKTEARTDLRQWPKVRELLNRYCEYQLQDDELLLIWLHDGWYYISDIGLRMLTPRELYAANGFPPDYIIDRDHTGNPYPKTKQVARCGNAVPPPFTTAIVRANAPEYCGDRISTIAELYNHIAV